MPDKYGKEKTTVRIDAQLFEDMQLACIKRKTSQTEAIEEGIKLWLASAQNTATLVPGSNKEKVPPTKDPVGSLTQTLDQYGTNPYAELTVIVSDLMAASDTLRATASRVNGIIDKGGSTDFVGANINDAGHVVSGEKTTEQIIAESYRKLDEFERSDEQVGGEGEPRKGGDRQATGRGSKGKRGAA